MLLLLEYLLHNSVQNVTLACPLYVSGITSRGLFHTSWQWTMNNDLFNLIYIRYQNIYILMIFFGTRLMYIFVSRHANFGIPTPGITTLGNVNSLNSSLSLLCYCFWLTIQQVQEVYEVGFRKLWNISANPQCANYSSYLDWGSLSAPPPYGPLERSCPPQTTSR